MESEIKVSIKEMAELESRMTRLNIESESILAWLRIKRIEYQKEHDKSIGVKLSVDAYIKDAAEKAKKRKK